MVKFRHSSGQTLLRCLRPAVTVSGHSLVRGIHLLRNLHLPFLANEVLAGVVLGSHMGGAIFMRVT